MINRINVNLVEESVASFDGEDIVVKYNGTEMLRLKPDCSYGDVAAMIKYKGNKSLYSINSRFHMDEIQIPTFKWAMNSILECIGVTFEFCGVYHNYKGEDLLGTQQVCNM